MVDVASGVGRASGRSQRSRTRIDYTSQIYINVPTKAATDRDAATSKAKHRNSKENKSPTTGSDKRQKRTPSTSQIGRASKSATGSSKRLRGNALQDKSNEPIADSPVGPESKAKAPQEASENMMGGKRCRNGGASHEEDPASIPTNADLPQRQKRSRTGDTAEASKFRENMMPGGSPPEERQPNQSPRLHDPVATTPATVASEPCPADLADRVIPKSPVQPLDHVDTHADQEQRPPLVFTPAVDDMPSTDDGRARSNAEAVLQQRILGDPGAAPEGGRSEIDVNVIFSRQHGLASLNPQVSRTTFETLGKLVDNGNHKRVQAAQQEVRALTAENEKQSASIRQLTDELERQEARHTQHQEQVSKQLQRMKINYQTLYDRFQKLRGRSFEDAREVLEGIWQSVEERSEIADQLIDAWKADAETHHCMLRDSELHAAKQELGQKQSEVLELKGKLLEEAKASLLQAQEIANLRHMVKSLDAVRPQTTDAAVQAQPEVSFGTTQTRSRVSQYALASPVISVQARRRAQALDVTCMARSLVPEGADVHSVDTAVMRAALLKPTEPSHMSHPLASVVAAAVDASTSALPEAAEEIRSSPAACLPAGVVAAEASLVPGARISSSVRLRPVQAICAMDAVARSNSERGSNAAVAGHLVATPQQHALILRKAEQPVCSDPGPVRPKIAHGGPHCLRVPVPQQQLQGTPGLFASPGIPSNVAEIGDTGPPDLENLQDGGPMSTSESEQRYGDAGDVVGAACCDGDVPLVNDDTASGGSDPGAADGPIHTVAERCIAEPTTMAPVTMGTPARSHPGTHVHGHGDLDSGRSTDVDAQMRMFRDKMLSMEVIQSPYGTEYQCRDMKSGFTFTIKPCVSSAPAIRMPGHEDTPGIVDELTYVPHMETCPEHVKEKLPQVFQEGFDFRADHLHGLQKRIDRALEVVNGSL